ncbi:MAG: hypothetical protein Phog2KO_50780 [Phototrophicaceae bacterium]
MVNDIQDIFDEYTRLRLNGLETSEAINVLHPHIKGLSDVARDELAMIIRKWEAHKTNYILDDDRERLAQAGRERDANEVIVCPNCDKKNTVSEVICNYCGYLLKDSEIGTDLLPPQSSELIDDAIFPNDGLLILLSETDISYTLRPQLGLSRLTIGRDDKLSPVDIDLEDLDSSERGVSRLHATIIYDDKSRTLSLLDMDSTNGSFINEQRLHPSERRVIRHGDKLRFGGVSLKVLYRSESQ